MRGGGSYINSQLVYFCGEQNAQRKQAPHIQSPKRQRGALPRVTLMLISGALAGAPLTERAAFATAEQAEGGFTC